MVWRPEVLFNARCRLQLRETLYVGGQRMYVIVTREKLRVLNSSKRSDVEQTR